MFFFFFFFFSPSKGKRKSASRHLRRPTQVVWGWVCHVTLTRPTKTKTPFASPRPARNEAILRAWTFENAHAYANAHDVKHTTSTYGWWPHHPSIASDDTTLRFISPTHVLGRAPRRRPRRMNRNDLRINIRWSPQPTRDVFVVGVSM